MSRLDGKVAIVTAAGRGIGHGIATLFAEEGAKIVVASLGDAECKATTEEILAAGGKAVSCPTNVGNKDDVLAMVRRAIEEFGQLDILANVAQSFGTRANPTGQPVPNPVQDFSDDEIDWTFDTGFRGSMWAMQAAFPHLRGRDGRVINFGSFYGVTGQAGTLAYNVTKEAIRALTRTAAREWATEGVTVNAINPAARTDAVANIERENPDVYAAATGAIPMKRLGDPYGDIGPAALFLASADSRYITGQTLAVDGGLVMHA
jgi:NAD(P)-dependent dehydrogenase (short-subunit alcohol dehydrogenase family)